jgi:hypothetical protein
MTQTHHTVLETILVQGHIVCTQNLQDGQYSRIIDLGMAGKRRIIKSLGDGGCGLEAESRYLSGRTSENYEKLYY